MKVMMPPRTRGNGTGCARRYRGTGNTTARLADLLDKLGKGMFNAGPSSGTIKPALINRRNRVSTRSFSSTSSMVSSAVSESRGSSTRRTHCMVPSSHVARAEPVGWSRTRLAFRLVATVRTGGPKLTQMFPATSRATWGQTRWARCLHQVKAPSRRIVLTDVDRYSGRSRPGERGAADIDQLVDSGSS